MHIQKALNQAYSGMLLQVVEVTRTVATTNTTKVFHDTLESQYGFTNVPIEDEGVKIVVSEPKWVRIASVLYEREYNRHNKLTFELEGIGRIFTYRCDDEAYMASIIRTPDNGPSLEEQGFYGDDNDGFYGRPD